MIRSLVLLSFFLLFNGCSEDPPPPPPVEPISGCEGCHPVTLDQNHRLACTSCHLGVDNLDSAELSHQGLVAQPAHPDNAERFCGQCHEEELHKVKNNPHYSLTGHVNSVRSAFKVNAPAATISELSSSQEPETVLQLVDDLLRRRCLRCHVYYQGDDFPAVRHATGCGSCHLDFEAGKLRSHEFLARPSDSRCLSCHYGNHIGADYYGRYEHDYNVEYRTPYTTTDDFFRPFGVEYHQLETDLHQKAGMLCIDCHSRSEVMEAQADKPSCAGCHERRLLEVSVPKKITATREGYEFVSPATGISLPVPVIENPVHERYRDKVLCQVCHARWGYNDTVTHLIRIDHDEFESFSKLSLDGSSEVNRIIGSHLEFEGEWLDPVMSDKFSGELFRGIWHKAFSERRWDQVLLTRDDEGIIVPARPILDLRLSWIDRDEIVRFDNITPVSSGLRPYTPHTTGPAGLLYEERIRTFLADEKINVLPLKSQND